MSPSKTPVERYLVVLRDLWLEATNDPGVRLIVWRIPSNADRMLAAFFEAQRHVEQAMVPDFFSQFRDAFDTGFGYSRSLQQAIGNAYANRLGALKEQGGMATEWPEAETRFPYSAAGVLRQFEALADYHAAHIRLFAAVLTPASVTSQEAWRTWLEAALPAPIPENIRLCVVDYAETRQWQALADAHEKAVRIIEAPIDLFDIARETAVQIGGTGPAAVYRQCLTEVMTLLEHGSAGQTVELAEQAMKLVEQNQWHDQQVVLHMAMAGAQMKEQQYDEAIARYRQARACATQAEAQKSPTGANLVVQAWFGEAGASFGAREYENAAKAYAQGAEAARRIPHGMFAMEGFRMAGFSLTQANQRGPAYTQYLKALAEANALTSADRPMTTLPLLLQDMLRHEDPRRTEELEQQAERYRAEMADALNDAEMQAQRLGAEPAPAAIERIEAQLHARLTERFEFAMKMRERVISGAGEPFGKIVAFGRRLLHPAWNGLPEITHPLDKEIAEWRDPPQWAVLPDPSDLLTSPALAKVEEGAA